MGSFSIHEPLLLGLTTVAAVMAAAGFAAVRARRAAASAGGAPSYRFEESLLGRTALSGLAAAGVVALLITSQSAAAEGLLLLAALLASAWLTVASYRAQRVGGAAARACLRLRVVAWLALLLLIGRPSCEWSVVEWEKPVLAVLLDQSKSMSIADAVPSAAAQSRAAQANEALHRTAELRREIERLYDVRMLAVGDAPQPQDDWQITPRAALSAIAAALRQAGQARSISGEAPAAVLLVSDGAENAADPQMLRQAAMELAGQRTALLAVGVGPQPGKTPSAEIEPLAAPGRIGSRERFRLPVYARVLGCGGLTVQLHVLWDGAAVAAASESLAVSSDSDRLHKEFDLEPPGHGLHRLTARLTLPPQRGGTATERSVIIDVRDDHIRVLFVDVQARSETAFAARALRTDPRFEVTQLLLPAARNSPSPDWRAYDVIVFGPVPAGRIGIGSLHDLAEAVSTRGVGLLLAGGRDVFNDIFYARSDLLALSPVALVSVRPADEYHPAVLPTDAGLRHPIFQGSGANGATPAKDSFALLRTLPGGSAARLGTPKPTAEVLALSEEDDPLLATIEVGRGRTLAAAWENTWPWALSSDGGFTLHRQLWRQMTTWLANRRPAAWVLSDQAEYTVAGIAGGQPVRIRGGMTGLDASNLPPGGRLDARLKIRAVAGVTRPATTALSSGPASQPAAAPPPSHEWTVAPSRHGDEWRVELPAGLPANGSLNEGAYELEFSVESAGRTWEARSRFEVRKLDRELEQPNSNIALLQEAADLTAGAGGRFVELAGLNDVLDKLSRLDRRRRIERVVDYDLASRQPWVLWLVLTGALAGEWFLRKRLGAN